MSSHSRFSLTTVLPIRIHLLRPTESPQSEITCLLYSLRNSGAPCRPAFLPLVKPPWPHFLMCLPHILVPGDSDESTLVPRCHFYFTSSHPPFLVKEYPSGM